MKVFLIGIGAGTIESMTREAILAVQEAKSLIGAARMLRNLPQHEGEEIQASHAKEILEALKKKTESPCAVIFSGDTGFYSGVKSVLPMLQECGYEVCIYPGISSLQLLASRIKRPWQDWTIASAHGSDVNVRKCVMLGKPVFLLTSGSKAPGDICRDLCEAGLSELQVTVAENLGYADEKVETMSAQSCSQREFAKLNVLLIDKAPVYQQRTPGIPDDEFIRAKVPMTKQEVRAAILAKLAVSPQDCCWDIGGGTGSVSVELALHGGSVWSVEKEKDALELMEQNKQRFCAYNMHIVKGMAEDVVESLPAPDKVFVGGSCGQMCAILNAALTKNSSARICVSAIALETLQTVLNAFEELGMKTEVAQISVSRTQCIGTKHLLMAQNPIFLITGERV